MIRKKLFKKYFSFLLKEGFEAEFFVRNSEIEAYYRFRSSAIEMYLDGYSNRMDVILKNGSGRRNLFDCSFYEKNERDELRRQIEETNDLELKFSIFSTFLSKNIDDLKSL